MRFPETDAEGDETTRLPSYEVRGDPCRPGRQGRGAARSELVEAVAEAERRAHGEVPRRASELTIAELKAGIRKLTDRRRGLPGSGCGSAFKNKRCPARAGRRH